MLGLANGEKEGWLVSGGWARIRAEVGKAESLRQWW